MVLGRPQKCVGEIMPIESPVKEYAPRRILSIMDIAFCPKAELSLHATYLQFPVAEKYKIIWFLHVV